MRLYPVLALMTSAFALAACGGGGGGGFGGSVLGTGGVSAGVGQNCPLTGVNNTPDPTCLTTGSTGGGTPTPPIVDTDGDGVPDGVTDTDGTTGSGAGGNTTNTTTGNRSIFLAKNALDRPTKTGTTAISTLASESSTNLAQVTEQILGAPGTTRPKKLLFKTNTQSAANSTLAVAQVQTEDFHDTRDLRWIDVGHSTASRAVIAAAVVDRNGNPLKLDSKGNFVYSVADPGGSFDADEEIDISDDAIWNQITPYMTAKANGGSGSNYRGYRLRSSDPLNQRDEALQVWAWKDSYATQYVNGASDGEPKQDIWSFGGRAAQNVPTGGSSTYNGRWVGNAKTDNWTQPKSSNIAKNSLWRVQGKSTFTVDFDNSKLTGKLSTETWTSKQEDQPNYTWYTQASGTPSVDTIVEPEFNFYNTRINITGDLVNNGTLGAPKNQIVGNASLNGEFSTGDNKVLGGLFGTNSEELTGVFHVNGGYQQPPGGTTGLTDGAEGVVIFNGAFNAECTKAAGNCIVTP
jgi:hypothetical protein